ncbi:universal stress protein [Novosphingobium sp. BL-8H]|uniref:universal stress protein n=1 Tax=Novosphingobium sp. BL-8H TaxID=3127640 RepID=UPI003756F95E
MKNILLPVHEDSGQEARLLAALAVTRAVAGHLMCLDVIVPPTPLGFGLFGDYQGAASMIALDSQQRSAARNRARLEPRLGYEDIEWSWQETMDFPAHAIRRAEMLADLVVLSARLDKAGSFELKHLCQRLAGSTGRAILAVPPPARELNLAGTVVIAWNGSSEVQRALREAVPLLKLASEVVLLSIVDPMGPFAANDAATYLSRHGIRPQIYAADRLAGEHVCEVLLTHAQNLGASYIVLGAFHHPPTLEALWGGVTHSMLASSDMPLLLSH